MSVHNWAGNFVLVTARFRRTISYGLVSFIPIDQERTLVRNIVWVPCSRTWLGRHLVDPIDARIRFHFIREFVRSDVNASTGIRYHPQRLIEADNAMARYLRWLQELHLHPPIPELL
jgi:hypothetical protein